MVLAFAKALNDGDFDTAQLMLSLSLRDQYSPDELGFEFRDMFGYANTTNADHVNIINLRNSLPLVEEADVEWVFVGFEGVNHIDGGFWLEMIGALVSNIEDQLLIRLLEWGRP